MSVIKFQRTQGIQISFDDLEDEGPGADIFVERYRAAPGEGAGDPDENFVDVHDGRDFAVSFNREEVEALFSFFGELLDEALDRDATAESEAEESDSRFDFSDDSSEEE